MEDETQSPLIPDPTIPGTASRHFCALDGLRGIAILLVVVFHGCLVMEWSNASFQWYVNNYNWGWVGVDVFFVLSGFLITGILLDTRDAARYFRNFYARRVLRIIPVYYLLLGFIFFVLPAFVPFDSDGLQMIRRNQGWFWTHTTNWGFLWHRRVWGGAEWLNLNHFWSLAIEEQFYLCWPLAVFLVNRKRLQMLCWACIIGSIALRATIWQLKLPFGAIFFPTFCRVDTLAIGSLLAIWIRGDVNPAKLQRNAKVAMTMGMAALIAMVIWRGGFWVADPPNIVFGVTLVGIVTAGVIAHVIDADSRNRTAVVLTWKPLRSVGKYAYGLYLYHSVIMVALAYVLPPRVLIQRTGNEWLGNGLFFAMFFTLSLLTAFLSWHLFEKHWLKLKTRFDYRIPTTPAKAGANEATTVFP